MDMLTQHFRLPNKSHVFLVSALALGGADSASALMFDFSSDSELTIGPNSISTTTDGVTATATAYHVEFTDDTSTIYGPFTTDRVVPSPPARQAPTDVFFSTNRGLGLRSAQDLGQVDDDLFPGGSQPGFDNLKTGTDPLVPESMQFALFSFDAPLDISDVTLGAVSNFSRAPWVAGGSSAPDLAEDIISAFEGFDVINLDRAIPATRTFSTLEALSWFAVGTQPSQALGTVGPFRPYPLTAGGGGTQFWIDSFGFELAQNGGPIEGPGEGPGKGPVAVPEPGTLGLLALGLGYFGFARRRSQR